MTTTIAVEAPYEPTNLDSRYLRYAGVIKVTVLSNDIKSAKRGNSEECPVALAVRRVTKESCTIYINRGDHQLWFCVTVYVGSSRCLVSEPSNLAAILWLYDRGGPFPEGLVVRLERPAVEVPRGVLERSARAVRRK